ncbi:hypothetical protein WN943_027726 [Citrus x changshan-huyou]
MANVLVSFPSPPPASGSKSFAQVVGTSSSPSTSMLQLPKPIKRGDLTCIKITKSIYQQQLRRCHTNLIGRLLLHPGSTPLKTHELCHLLQVVWKTESTWTLVPLTRGYFDVHFSNKADMQMARSGGICSLPFGVFRLYQWKKDFDPYDPALHTHAQVWVHLYGLSQEYSNPRTLLEIACAIGAPLQLDKPTKEGTFGHFAQVLVDVDLLENPPPQILVEREEYSFEIIVYYENLPCQCPVCSFLGHNASNYRRNREIANTTHKPAKNPSKRVFRPITSIEVVQNTSPDEVVEKATSGNEASPPQSYNPAIMVHKPPSLVDTSLRQPEIDPLTSETYRLEDEDLSLDDPPEDVSMNNHQMADPSFMIHSTNQLEPLIEPPITTDQMIMSPTTTSLLSQEIQTIVDFTKNASPVDEDGFQTVQKHKKWKARARSFPSEPYFARGSGQNMEK